MTNFLYTARFFLKNSNIFLLNFIGITLGIASTITIIGIVIEQYNYDSFYPQSEQIYRLVSNKENGWECSTPKPLAPALISEIPEIENAARFYTWYGYLACSSEDKKITEKTVIFADFSFLEMLQIPFVYGGYQATGLDNNSVLLSRKAAIKYYCNSNPVGKQLMVGKDRLFTIKGVYEDFSGNSNFIGDLVFDISIIHKLTQVYFPDEWNHNSEFSTFILLNEESDKEVVLQKVFDLHKKNSTEKVMDYELQELNNIHINKNISWESKKQINVNYLYLLILVSSMIFFMSLGNFIILYIATSRKREVGIYIRMVFGATKKLLFFEYLFEVYVIFFCALLFSKLFVELFKKIMLSSYETDKVILFTWESVFPYVLLIALLLAGGIFTAYILAKNNTFKIVNKEKLNKARTVRFINYLVVTQFSLCVLLIISTIVICRQSSFLKSFDTGFAHDELITIPLNMHLGEGFFNEKLDAFCAEIKNHYGIKNITLGFSSPALVETSSDLAEWEGNLNNVEVKFCWNSIYYDYFETLGVQIIDGREFNRDFPNDFDYDASKSNYILNLAAVKEMGIEDPVGKEFSMYGFKGEIIGIVEDFHFRSLHERISPMAFDMKPFYFNEIIIRTNSIDNTVLAHIENIWNKFAPENALEINYVTSQIENNYKQEDDLAKMVNSFTVIAIILAVLGLITLTITATQQRIKEIGIRKINGASLFQILLLLNKDYLKWITIGFLMICPVAWYIMSAWLNNFAFRTHLSTWIFVSTGCFTLILGICIVSLQSWKIANKNPVESLRYE